MRRNWQPINLSNFEADFAIFQPTAVARSSYVARWEGLSFLLNPLGSSCTQADSRPPGPPAAVARSSYVACWEG